jgi:hypothetical protein
LVDGARRSQRISIGAEFRIANNPSGPMKIKDVGRSEVRCESQIRNRACLARPVLLSARRGGFTIGGRED